MGLSWRKRYLLVVWSLWRIVEYWRLILLWIMTKSKFTGRECECNLSKKCRRYHRPRRWKWKKKLIRSWLTNLTFISTDSSFMIILSSCWLRKGLWLFNMLILRGFKEYQRLWELRFYRLLIVLIEVRKFLELVIRLNRFWLERTKSLGSQDARETKLAPSCSEDPANTLLMRLKGHFMMHCVCWFRLSRTKRLFMGVGILKFKWLFDAKNWLRPSEARKL